MKTDDKIFKRYISQLNHCLEALDTGVLEKAVEAILKACSNDKQVFICGNGGSAATSSHLACDLGKGMSIKGKKRPRVISLTDNVSLITAWSNDTCYENCFVEQLANILNEGDLLIGISASGNSGNVLKAVEYAKSKGASTIGLVGFGGGKLQKIADIPVLIDSNEYEVVEDIQLCAGHIIKRAIMEKVK
ncbi:SIS domain-containing protein [Candidatus Omnitrophota bacterium]